MTQWFDERYITRGEHQEIVAYYRKLVAQLHRKVSDLRTQVDAQAAHIGAAQPVNEVEAVGSPADTAADVGGGNVIRVDFRRLR
ncbi:MAG: DUF2730 domain-containing protein [Rhizobium sp.]|nr:DUF2730 domain-containing protein [Rhizobium sp.]